MSYIGYYMFSLLQAIQGRWFSICLDDVLHVEYSRPHHWQPGHRPAKASSQMASWGLPAKANPAYATPIAAWPPGKPIAAWPAAKTRPAAKVPKVIPAKISIPAGVIPAKGAMAIPAKIESTATYAGQPRSWPPKALAKLTGPPKRLVSTPKQGWRRTRPSISLKTARGTVQTARGTVQELVSQEEWLSASQQIDVDFDAEVATPVEDDGAVEDDPYHKVESDDSEDGQSISYYMNSLNTILVTFLTPPQATHPTLPSQPPLPKPNPSNPTTLTKAKSYQANHPYQSQILPSQILVRWMIMRRRITHGELGELASRSMRRRSMVLMKMKTVDFSLPVFSKILEATTQHLQGEMWRHSTGDMC